MTAKPALTLRKAPDGGQLDMFAPSFVDVAFRDQQDLMERPFCCLSKTPRRKPLSYKVGEAWIEITANEKYGMATIYDHDVLIWAATQIREAEDRGMGTGKRLVFHPHALLKAIRRETGGTDYRHLEQSLNRLAGTLVTTNIRAEEARARSRRKQVSFHLIEQWGLVEGQSAREDRWFIDVPDWFYAGVRDNKLVLTIHPDYFLLESGIDRFLYRCFRKHTGRQPLWHFTMRQLHEKSGSPSRLSDFAQQVRARIARQVEYGHIPEYAFEVQTNGDGEEVVYGVNRYELSPGDKRYAQKPIPNRRGAGGFGKNPFLPQRSASREFPARASGSDPSEDTCTDGDLLADMEPLPIAD